MLLYNFKGDFPEGIFKFVCELNLILNVYSISGKWLVNASGNVDIKLLKFRTLVNDSWKAGLSYFEISVTGLKAECHP